MDYLLEWTTRQLAGHGLAPDHAVLAATGLGLTVVVLLAWLGNWVTKHVLLRVVLAIVRRTAYKWDDALMRTGVFSRLSHLVPAMIINAFLPGVLGGSPEALAGVHAVVNIYLTFIWLTVFFALLDGVHLVAEETGRTARVPVKGFVQAIKLVATLVAAILVLGTVLDKSPLYLLSGLGALTAVMLLVFRDAILGFVAGIMISVNELVRIGDWIEMPKAGADGDVIDVSLTTVKVQNWDKTITTIPTYDLISSSFKNWRGMSEAGGRRIKRPIHLDLQTVRFADEAMLARWAKIDLLASYLKEKQAEIDEANRSRSTDLTILGNGRRITNVGTFRAYCVAYLRQHPMIHQDLTFLVRQLKPTEHGLPLEIYVFCNDIRWAEYEAVQADIFDHLLSVVGEFGLRTFQRPAGADLQAAIGPRPHDDPS